VYLVDTNIISAGAPSRVAPAAVIAWMDRHSTVLSISVATVVEIEDGIAKLRREGASRKSADLATWWRTVLHLYRDKILPLDVASAQIAGALSDEARGRGQAPGLADIIIAATARRHGLTILSRNVRHFVPLGVPVIDPFDTLPPE